MPKREQPTAWLRLGVSGFRTGTRLYLGTFTILVYPAGEPAEVSRKPDRKREFSWKNSRFSGIMRVTLPVPLRVETWGHRSASQTVTVVTGAMPARA